MKELEMVLENEIARTTYEIQKRVNNKTPKLDVAEIVLPEQLRRYRDGLMYAYKAVQKYQEYIKVEGHSYEHN